MKKKKSAATLMNSKNMDGVSRDIGQYAKSSDEARTCIMTALQSQKGVNLKLIKDEIGSPLLTRRRLSFPPEWIIKQAFENECESNRADAYKLAEKTNVPLDDKIISSHVISIGCLGGWVFNA